MLLLPVVGIAFPSADTAEGFEICTSDEVTIVPGAMVAFTTATTPFDMVVVLNPVTRQTILPDALEHDTALLAAEAAEPVETLTAENTDAEYPIFHWRPAGCAPPLFDRERFKATVLPGLPVAVDRLRETDCARAVELKKSKKPSRAETLWLIAGENLVTIKIRCFRPIACLLPFTGTEIPVRPNLEIGNSVLEVHDYSLSPGPHFPPDHNLLSPMFPVQPAGRIGPISAREPLG